MPNYSVVAGGQVASAGGTLVTGGSDIPERYTLSFANTGAYDEAITITLTMARLSATARRIFKGSLAPDETLYFHGVPLSKADVLAASSSNDSTVDYTVSLSPSETPMGARKYDALGAIVAAQPATDDF